MKASLPEGKTVNIFTDVAGVQRRYQLCCNYVLQLRKQYRLKRLQPDICRADFFDYTPIFGSSIPSYEEIYLSVNVLAAKVCAVHIVVNLLEPRVIYGSVVGKSCGRYRTFTVLFGK